MENKNIAFDYIHEILFRNINADENVLTDNRISMADKQELAFIANAIKNIGKDEMTRIFQENIKNSFDTMMSLKTSIQDVISDAKRAYKYVSWMYIVAFYLGVALVVIAIVFAALDKTILSIAFGTIGLADIIGHFIFKPPLELQSSRANLAQLMVILTNWFSDVSNLNSYFSQPGKQFTLDEIEKISDKQNSNTRKMIELIEKYCEPAFQSLKSAQKENEPKTNEPKDSK